MHKDSIVFVSGPSFQFPCRLGVKGSVVASDESLFLSTAKATSLARHEIPKSHQPCNVLRGGAGQPGEGGLCRSRTVLSASPPASQTSHVSSVGVFCYSIAKSFPSWKKKQQVEEKDPMERLKRMSQGDVRLDLPGFLMGQQSSQQQQSVVTLDPACSLAPKPWMWW